MKNNVESSDNEVFLSSVMGDYHTHTTFSHGKGKIEQNVNQAIKVGLRELAITDHGFNHMTYNVSKRKLPQMRTMVDELKESTGLSILLGMETNILDKDGTIDLNDEQTSNLDIILCGFHKLIKTSVSGFFSFTMPNLAWGLIKKSSNRRKISNTDAFIKAISRYNIAIITHPSLGIGIDLKELAKACAYYGVFLELNGKHVTIKKNEVEGILNEGARFIMNSDAHHPNRVGEVGKPMQFITDIGLSHEYVVNIGKLPDLRKVNK